MSAIRNMLVAKTVRNFAGFSLLEISFTLLLLSLLSTLLLPDYQTLINEIKLNFICDELLSSIQLARSEAIKCQCLVRICASADGQHCGENWEKGWLIQRSHKKNELDVLYKGMIRKYGPIPAKFNLKWKGTRGVPFLEFNIEGMASGRNGRFVFGKNKFKKKFREILISATGRPRVQ